MVNLQKNENMRGSSHFLNGRYFIKKCFLKKAYTSRIHPLSDQLSSVLSGQY